MEEMIDSHDGYYVPDENGKAKWVPPFICLRDQFAMAALTGILANPSNKITTLSSLIKLSFEIADIAMKAREVKS